MLINHITLSTGHSALHRLDTLDSSAIETCVSILPRGGQIPGFAAFRVEIKGPTFTLYRGREPLVICGLGHGKSDVWRALERIQNMFGQTVANPPDGNWLAVVILPALANLAPVDIGWLGDFERCLAAAIVQKSREKSN